MLLSRAPNSRPAFRRSTRLTSDETRVLKPKKRSNNQITSLSQTTSSDHADSWQGNDATLEVIGLPEINESANSSKRRMSRNVGGWITPSFSSKIDRIWLSKNDNSGLNFDPSFYVPQIGDTVL